MEILPENNEFVEKRYEAMEKKALYLEGIDIDKALFLDMNDLTEDMHDERFEIRDISVRSKELLSGLDTGACLEKRNYNARYLEAMLPFFDGFMPVLDRIGDATPLYYPIYVDDRDSLRQFMVERGIYLSVLWGRTPGYEKGCFWGDAE